ncbi:MAG: chemotaxis protein CheW [Magnetococcus sp. YQC-3]
MAFNAWNLFDEEEEARRWVSQQMVAPSADSRQWLLCQVGGQICGLPVDRIQQMVQCTQITPIPHLPPFLPGLFNLHGEVIPVLDLRLRLALPVDGEEGRPILVIVRIEHSLTEKPADGTEAGKLVALRVDALLDLVFLRAEEMQLPEATATVGTAVDGRPILLGTARHREEVIHLLDSEALLSREEMLAAIAGHT